MKTLVLMRHAKSDWGTPADSDFDRPLNTRGQKSAAALGTWLREKALHPTEALVSSARRTQETWERLAIRSCQAWFLEGLYHASAPQILMALRQAREDTVLVIGHNPGIASFAADILGPHEDLPPDFHRYPTGATSIITFPAKTWDQVSPGTGRLVDFVTPRSLTD